MNSLRKRLSGPTGRAVMLSFASSLVAKVAQIAMAVLAARILQPTGFGIFTFAMGVGLLGGRLGGLGWPVLMNRFVPKYRVTQDWSSMRGLLRAGHAVVLGGALTTGLLCLGLGLWVGPEDELYLGLLLGALLLPIMAFRSLYRNILAALKVPQKGILVDEFLPAVIMTGVLLVLLGTALTPETATLFYIAASLVAVLFGAWWIRGVLPGEIAGKQPDYAMRLWMGTALPALVGMSARLLMNKTDVLMLAPLGTMEDVGLYGAALRATYVQVAAVIVLSTVITARISEAFAAGQEKRGKRLFFGAMAFAVICSLPFGVLLVVFDDWTMGTFFGESYLPGAPVLSILAIAQIGASVNIPATSFMLMTGRQALFGWMTTAALALNVGLNVLLIPGMGATGAALATCISILALSVLQIGACLQIIRSKRYEEIVKKKKTP